MRGALTQKMPLLMFRGNVCFNMVRQHVCQERGYGHIPPHIPILQEHRDHSSTCPPPASLTTIRESMFTPRAGQMPGGLPSAEEKQ